MHGVIVYDRIQFNKNPQQGQTSHKYCLDQVNHVSLQSHSSFLPLYSILVTLCLLFLFLLYNPSQS